MNKRQKAVFEAVGLEYKNPKRKISKWMWDYHLKWVAKKCLALARKYGANEDLIVAGALLHDIADVVYERDNPDFDRWTFAKAKEVLNQAGFSNLEIEDVLENIIKPHSCRGNNLPKTIEGKVMATADAMFHLQTDFFAQFKKMGLPRGATESEWKSWARKKIEKDRSKKIFFADEKKQVEGVYDRLKRKFS